MGAQQTAGLNFEFTDEQRRFRKTLRDFTDRKLSKDYCREVEARDAFPRDLWQRIADQGLHGIGVPEEYDGEGGTIIEQMIVAEELSRTMAGLIWIWGVTAFAGVKTVGSFGTEEQKQRVLPAVAAGEMMWSIALTEPGGGTDVLGAMKTRAERVDAGWSITGAKPLGQFQAVQHMIANAAMSLEAARLLTYRAAWLQLNGRPCGVEATTAKVLASEACVKAADDGIQILGGNGYALEYDMQRYWRDMRLYRIAPINNEMGRNYIGESLGLPRSF